MKKILALALLLGLCLSLFGCEDKEGGSTLGAAYEVIYDEMTRYNCKDGTCYDKNYPESNDNWRSRHNGFELGALALYGCDRTAEGYRVVDAEDFGIKYQVGQNLGALMTEAGSKNGAESLWVNRDGETSVLGTDIRTAVGVGAYFVEVIYSDGERDTFSKTNFFENAQNGMLLDILDAEDIDSRKTVKTIEVTLVYEMYAGGPGILGIWWHEYTNWRCEYTYHF